MSFEKFLIRFTSLQSRITPVSRPFLYMASTQSLTSVSQPSQIVSGRFTSVSQQFHVGFKPFSPPVQRRFKTVPTVSEPIHASKTVFTSIYVRFTSVSQPLRIVSEPSHIDFSKPFHIRFTFFFIRFATGPRAVKLHLSANSRTIHHKFTSVSQPVRFDSKSSHIVSNRFTSVSQSFQVRFKLFQISLTLSTSVSNPFHVRFTNVSTSFEFVLHLFHGRFHVRVKTFVISDSLPFLNLFRNRSTFIPNHLPSVLQPFEVGFETGSELFEIVHIRPNYFTPVDVRYKRHYFTFVAHQSHHHTTSDSQPFGIVINHSTFCSKPSRVHFTTISESFQNRLKIVSWTTILGLYNNRLSTPFRDRFKIVSNSLTSV